MRNVQRYSQNVWSWICRHIKNIHCKTLKGTVTNLNIYLTSYYFSCKTQGTLAVLDWAMSINGWFPSFTFILYSIKICFCMKQLHSSLKQKNCVVCSTRFHLIKGTRRFISNWIYKIMYLFGILCLDDHQSGLISSW